MTLAGWLVVGLRRVYHLDEMEDQGFALLTGGRRCPSRHLVGGWRRHLRWYEVDAFCRRTSPWHLIRDAIVLASYTAALRVFPHNRGCAARNQVR